MTQTLSEPALQPCPSRVDQEQLERFRRDGYLAFSHVLDPMELREAREALLDLTRRLVEGSEDKVDFHPPRSGSSANHAGACYQFKGDKCFLQLEPDFDPVGRPFEEVDLKVRKYMNFTGHHRDLKKILDPGRRIRGVVESLIGPNALLFQEMALVKPPFIGSEKPWHQDNAYFSVAPLDAIIGVWIALDDAKVENGCMHVLPGGHHIGALRHFHGNDCEIVEGRVDVTKARAVPVPAGGALFFYGLLPHETPPNRSPERRRALQFHFRSAESRIVDEATYNSIFVEADGTPASCKAASGR